MIRCATTKPIARTVTTKITVGLIVREVPGMNPARRKVKIESIIIGRTVSTMIIAIPVNVRTCNFLMQSSPKGYII